MAVYGKRVATAVGAHDVMIGNQSLGSMKIEKASAIVHTRSTSRLFQSRHALHENPKV